MRSATSGLVGDDLRLLAAGRVVELDGDEALAGAVLEVLEGALVAGVVGDDEQEAFGRLEDLGALLDRQQAAVVGQGVDEDGGVLARLDDLVQVADGAGLDGAGQRAVDPAGGLALEQVAADEVAGREVLVAGDGDEGQGLVELALGAGALRSRRVRGRPRRQAMYSTKRVLPQPVGPLRSTGMRSSKAAVNISISSPIGR